MKKTQKIIENKEFRFKTLIDVINVFSTEEKCLIHLKKMRWDDEPYCPFCACKRVYAFSDGKRYKCHDCRKKFTVKVGTIFEDTKIPLQKWFMAIYLLTAHKKGISSLQLGRDIGVTQKSAWFILHRLRNASTARSFQSPLKNIVEIDETYLGGKEKNKHISKRTEGTTGRSVKTKAPVLGLIERRGYVKVAKLIDVKGESIMRHVVEKVSLGTEIMTDDFRAYRTIAPFYNHKIINHSNKEYVIGDVHTNTIEGFWSLMKRSIFGIYHVVTVKHLDRYLNEFTYRYNTRSMTSEDRMSLLLRNCNARITYKMLIAEEQ